jgi:beta-glucosidase
MSDTRATDDGEITVGCKVTNTGAMPGAQIVQLYVAPPEGKAFRPAQELKGFEKVRLNPGETKTVWFKLGGRDFAHYEPQSARWCVESGEYEVRVGVSSRDIRLRAAVDVVSASAVFAVDRRAELPDYYAPRKGLEVSDAEFASLLGRAVPHYGVRPYTLDSTLSEALECEAGRAALAKHLEPSPDDDENSFKRMFAAMLRDMPLRSLGMLDDPRLVRANLPKFVEELNASK